MESVPSAALVVVIEPSLALVSLAAVGLLVLRTMTGDPLIMCSGSVMRLPRAEIGRFGEVLLFGDRSSMVMLTSLPAEGIWTL